MSQWDRSRSLDAFLDDLSARRGIGVEYIPRYRALTIAFLSNREGRPLEQLGSEDVETFVAARVAMGESDKQTKAARTAATAFVQFVRSGGLVAVARQAEQPRTPMPGKPGKPGKPPRATMLDDLRRVLTVEALIFGLALTAPLLLGFLGALFGLFGIILHYAALAGAFFLMLDHVAEGRAGLPKGSSENLAGSLWRGFTITVVGVAPAVLAGVYTGSLELMFAGAILGALLLPAAALAVYANSAGLAAFAPHLWVMIVLRIPREYLKVAALYVVLVASSWLWTVVAAMWLGPVGAMLRIPLGCLFVFAMATTLGGVVHRNRDELGIY